MIITLNKSRELNFVIKLRLLIIHELLIILSILND